MRFILIFIVITNCVAAFGQQRSWFVPIHTNSQPNISNIKNDLEGNVYIGGGLGPKTQECEANKAIGTFGKCRFYFSTKTFMRMQLIM